ncbi:DUF1146 family protein [Peribacillus acanthi]|uniref:DUF1146 family protein n=1 Tax=Peribacillus acanthi TaxID=2171554 RepID=UPI000D3E1941|nr:DUF1146 family protein [Peribacillus acanthi]
MFENLGQQAMFGIMSHLFFIAITWWALQSLNFDKILRANKVIQARVLIILLTLAIGSTVSGFFLDYLAWSNQLPFLYKE